MNTDVAGRVRNVQLPASKPLLPLFEVIINAIQAIEDANEKNGRIEIDIVRSPDLFDGAADRSLSEITCFVVKDNGIGFDAQNYEAFTTSDTTYKAKRGGKGIGRFVWLVAFQTVEVESVFHADGLTMRRSFAFCMRGEGIENPVCKEDSTAIRGTKVSLSGMNERLRKTCPKKLDTIAAFIVEEFLEYFIRSDCPQIVLTDKSTGETLDLDNFFDSEMKAKSSNKKIKIKGKSFDVLHVRLYSSHINEHHLYFCAHERVVLPEKLAGRIPNLVRRFKDDEAKEFVYAAYVTSAVLDEAVNADRTGFNMSEDAGSVLDGEFSLSEIRKGVCEECKAFLEPYTAPVAKQKREKVDTFVANEGAMYRPILKHLAHRIDDIEPEATNDEIDRHLYNAYHELQTNLREEGQRLMQDTIPDDADFEQFKERFNDYFEKVSEVNQADLARYVCHRRAIIDFLEKQLSMQEDGKYKREERIHSIIFPRGKTSGEVPFDEHNLWLVDERLAFHVFLSSDQPIQRAKVLQNESKKEPDIIVFDKACAFAETKDMPFTSIIIIEFKKPLRQAYTAEENPFVQVRKYIEDVQAGKAVTQQGRPIQIPASLPFYCYIVCDITPNLIGWAKDFELMQTPDQLGFFGFKKHYNAYVEVVSYNKLIADAKKRNAAFFARLGLLNKTI